MKKKKVEFEMGFLEEIFMFQELLSAVILIIVQRLNYS